MKKTRRMLALTMALAMTAALTACGGSAKPASSAAPAETKAAETKAAETKAAETKAEAKAEETKAEEPKAAEFPAEKLNYVVAAAAGGGLDIVSRCFSDQWGAALNTTFEYIYEDAGNSYAMGLNELSDDEEDEISIMCGLAESLPAMFQFQESKYSMEDLAWIGNVYSDANCVMVRKDDDRFKTMQDLIEYARSSSTPLTISTPQALTPANMTATLFNEKAGLKGNIIVYEGGSPARKDLIGGQVDISVGGVSTAVGIADQVRVLGIFGARNACEDLWPDAQVLSEFATDFEMPDMTVHCSIWTTKKMAEEHPEAYQLLVDTYKAALEDSAVKTNLENANQSRFIEYIDPAVLEEALATFSKVLVDNDALLNPKNQ